MKDVIRIEMEMDQQMSNDSKKSSSEYFAFKLQIRYKYFKNILNINKEVYELVMKNFNNINKIDELEEGIDIYFRYKGEMNKVSKLFNKYYLVEEKRSKKLTGRDQLISKDTYRYFMSIWVINLKKGDNIQIKGESFTIKAINNNDLVLIHLETGNKKVATYSIVKDYLQKL